jgi:iron complex outermembrane receptor protein
MSFETHRNLVKAALAISIELCLSSTQAQQPVQLASIEVQALRLSQPQHSSSAAVYQVQQPEVASQANVNLSEILQGIPGLQVNNRENYAQDLQISMRGFGARATFGLRGIRLYVDGIPATMPDGQGQSANIDLNSLDHVEVLTGPMSSLYGNSSGGTILATSREGQGADSLRLSSVVGSHAKQQTNIVLQGGAEDRAGPAYIISNSYFASDGFRQHSSADKVLSNAKLTWNLADGAKLNWVINHVNIDADDPGGLSKADWLANPRQQNAYLQRMKFNSRKTIEQSQTGLTWSKPIDAHNEGYVMAYLGNRSVTQYQTIPKTAQDQPQHAGGVIDFERQYLGADLRWINTSWANTRLVFGLALDQVYENRQGYENYQTLNDAVVYGLKGNLRRDEDNRQWNIDPYLQLSWQFAHRLKFDAGLRYSHVHFQSDDHYVSATNPDDSGSQNYHRALPSMALGWQVLDGLYLYGSYAKGFETPTFSELSYKPSLTESGWNTALQPSSSDHYELGLKTDQQLGELSLALFRIDTQNDIVSAGNYNGRATYRNADQTLRQGLELGWQRQLWRDLSSKASYSYLDATFAADVAASASTAAIRRGNQIPGIAKQQGFWALQWQPQVGLQAGLELRYMDKIYAKDDNSEYASSYAVLAAHLAYVWRYRDWQVNSFARVDNLLDRNYIGSVIVNDGNGRYYEAADGRNFSLGLTISKSF